MTYVLIYLSRLTCAGMLVALWSAEGCASDGKGGVSLSQTRVVLTANDPAQSVTIKNRGQVTYLIQSRVQRSLDIVGEVPFIVTPPLFRLGADSQNLLRIIQQGDAGLSPDRESLFYLAVTVVPAQALPSANENETQLSAQVSMGFRHVIKLLYRPQGLAISPELAYCRIRLTQTADGVRLDNPTPYYLTFGHLSFNQQVIDLDRLPSMLAPHGSQTYPVTEPVNQAEWQLITDYGSLSPRCHAPVPTPEEKA